MNRFALLWRNLLRRRTVERDLDNELRATVDLLVDEKVRSGLRLEEARRAAAVELGSVEGLKDEVRDVRAGAGLDALLQDVHFTLRQFRRAPGFTAVAVSTLALGIGANAAIFGVVKSVLLDALPYAEADRLVRVYGRFPDGTHDRALLRAAQVDSIAQRQRSFESMAAFDTVRDAAFGSDDSGRLVKIAWIEPQLFRTLGVVAAQGRTFVDEDRAAGHVPASGAEIGPDTARVVVASHAGWQRLLSGDPGVVGREVRINGIHRTVIGVLPRDFVGPMGPADFFFAFDLRPALGTGAGWLGVVGRLKPGTGPQAVTRELGAAREDLTRERAPEETLRVAAVPLRDAMVGGTRTPLLILLASAALVLLIACANLAGALLSRSLSRRREFAVRVALGAGRRRLIRQLLTESTVLALTGGAAGLILAQVLLSLLSGPARRVLPVYADVSLDPGAVLVTGLVSLATGLVFGLVPALAVSRAEGEGGLRDEARGATEGLRPRRLRGLLVAGQLALCASLLAGAGLLARSLWEMASAPLGFQPEGVLAASVRLLPRDYPTLAARSRFREELVERLRALPGVDVVAVANKPPAINPRTDPFTLEGAPPGRPPVMVAYASVSDDYFRVLRLPVRQGRTFDASDREGSPATAVISEAMARRHWPDGHAVGARIRLGGESVTVVGIVGDVRNDVTRPDAGPMAYRSHRQESTGRVSVLLRARGDPLALLRPLQREIAALDPTLPLQQGMLLQEAIGEGLAPRRLPVMLLTAFGALALLLASVGVYAMFAGMAAAREREFGVRLALGSRPRAIAALVLRQGAGWMAAGLAGGAAGIAFVVRLLRGWLYEVPPFDPLALGGAMALLLGGATLALLVPVRRAARVDPLVALRSE